MNRTTYVETSPLIRFSGCIVLLLSEPLSGERANVPVWRFHGALHGWHQIQEWLERNTYLRTRPDKFNDLA